MNNDFIIFGENSLARKLRVSTFPNAYPLIRRGGPTDTTVPNQSLVYGGGHVHPLIPLTVPG